MNSINIISKLIMFQFMLYNVALMMNFPVSNYFEAESIVITKINLYQFLQVLCPRP